jgi:predicted esterase
MRTLLIPTTTHGRVLVREAPKPRGVLVGFHGYAEDAEAQMARLDTIPGNDDWTLVSIQGLHRFYRGRGETVVSGWMVRQDREAMIADNVAYVDAALDGLSLAVRLKADATAMDCTNSLKADAARSDAVPLVFCGFSQGVAMAFRAAVLGRRPAAGVIGVGGDVPPELLAGTGTSFPPVLLMRGTREEWYTDTKMRSDVEALTARGVAVTPIVYDGGHEWTQGVSAAVGEWVKSRSKE